MSPPSTTEAPEQSEKPAHCRGLRPYFSRSRGACMLCRQRKKKCDETKPSCWTCQRSGRECVYPAVKPGTNKESDGGTGCDSRARSGSHQGTEFEAQTEGMEIGNGSASARSPTPVTGAAKSTVQSTCMVSSGTQTDLPLNTNSSLRQSPIKNTKSIILSLSESLSIAVSIPNSPALKLMNTEPSRKAAYFNALSNGFLEHYLHVTTEILVSNNIKENPFLEYVMPLAHSDNLLMEAVLCLGGTHLCASIEDPNPTLKRATLGLYGMVLQGLREKMTSNDAVVQNRQDRLRTMTIIMLLCHIESLQRHHRGTIFPHLKAFRSILLSMQDDMPSTFTSVDDKLQGSMLEIYSYLILVANITPYGLDKDRTLPLDSFVFSFNKRISGLQSSGAIFSSIEGLFSLIPPVSLFARQRLEEPEETISTGLRVKFEELEQKIKNWVPPEETDVVWDADRDSLASVYRHALLIYLKASKCGSIVNDTRIIQEIQEHVNAAMATMVSLAMSSMCSILLWPVMIVGSVLIIKPQQSMVYEGLRFSRYKTANVLQAIELLERLWRDPAPEAYGPYGLHYIMKKTGISICMS